MGGCVVSCDNEDTNHLERKGMGGKWKWGRTRMTKEEKGRGDGKRGVRKGESHAPCKVA